MKDIQPIYRKTLLLLCALCSFLLPVLAAPGTTAGDNEPGTDTNIVGHVVDKETGEHIAGVTIFLKGTSHGVSTDASGHYFLRNIKPGTYTLVMQSIGYRAEERKVTLVLGKTLEVNFEAVPDALGLDEVVVSANRQTTLRKEAPVLVSVLDDKLFKIANAVTVSQGLTFQPGLRVENDCQNCGFNQVRINGLDGRYSQILIDSRPSFSALAGVYGLEQIPANMVDRIEVIRGGGSALYGANAIGGVINIITKEPLFNSFNFTENLTLAGGRTPDNTVGFNGTIVGADGRIGGMIFGQNRKRTPWDANGDGFSELGLLKSNAFGGRIFFRPTYQDKISIEGHFIKEERRGGDRFDLPEHAASVAESIGHNIYSVNANWNHFTEDRMGQLQVYGAAEVIDRASYYGGIGDDNVGSLGHIPLEEFGTNFGRTKSRTYVGGVQYTHKFDRLLFAPARILVGAEYKYDSLKDNMPIRAWEKDEKTGESKNPPTNQYIHNGSQLAQIEWYNEDFTVLLGGRLDEHSLVKTEEGALLPIFSPRATLRYNPTEHISLRATYAMGFRAPQVFDEDLHVAVVGGESQRIVNRPGLKPEYSHNVTLSSDMYFHSGEWQGNLLVEGFYTRLLGAFTNEEIGSNGSFSLYQRVNGSGATVAGINLEGKLAWKSLSLQAGITYHKSIWDEAQEWGSRTLLSGETADTPKDINTLADNGPEKLEGFSPDGELLSLTSREMLRTPDLYGYLTVTYNPLRHLTLSATLNYTGSMYAPHVIEVGRRAAVIDADLVAAGKRPDTSHSENAPRWDRLEHTPGFWDLGAKISYDFSLFNTAGLQLYIGANNLLNQFQKDFDFRGFRDSAYIYGPTQPFSIYTGISISI